MPRVARQHDKMFLQTGYTTTLDVFCYTFIFHNIESYVYSKRRMKSKPHKLLTTGNLRSERKHESDKVTAFIRALQIENHTGSCSGNLATSFRHPSDTQKGIILMCTVVVFSAWKQWKNLTVSPLRAQTTETKGDLELTQSNMLKLSWQYLYYHFQS